MSSHHLFCPHFLALLASLLFFIPVNLSAQSSNSGIEWKTFSKYISVRDQNDPLGYATNDLSVSYEFPVSGLPQDKLRMLTDSLLVCYFGEDFIGMSPQGAVNTQFAIIEASGDYLLYRESNLEGKVEKNVNNVYVSVSSWCTTGTVGLDDLLSGGRYDKESVIVHVKQDLWFAEVWNFKEVLATYGISGDQFERWIKESLMFDGHTTDEINYGLVSMRNCKVKFTKAGLVVSLPASILRNSIKDSGNQEGRNKGVVTTIPWDKLERK